MTKIDKYPNFCRPRGGKFSREENLQAVMGKKEFLRQLKKLTKLQDEHRMKERRRKLIKEIYEFK